MKGKRDIPFTPIAVNNKKQREYASPITNKTPLRNCIKPVDMEEAADEPANLSIASIDRAKLSIHEKKTVVRSLLHSPVVGPSPKAFPLASPQPKMQSPKGKSGRSFVTTNSLSTNKLTVEQMNKTFEEWIKIAADNKINAKNTWNLALIDYFSEISFLQSGDSIDFQKASCTLDGCVKIYALRVDSIADETGKLLSGLAEGNKYVEHGDELPTNEQDPLKAADKPNLRRKTPRITETIEKSFEPISLRQLETEFFVDPLFKKMCVEFDESGSRGQLLSKLPLSAQGGIIFDSLTEPTFANTKFVTTVNSCQLEGKELVKFADIDVRTVPTIDYKFDSADEKNRGWDLKLKEALDKVAKISLEETEKLQMNDFDGGIDYAEDFDDNDDDCSNISGHDYAKTHPDAVNDSNIVGNDNNMDNVGNAAPNGTEGYYQSNYRENRYLEGMEPNLERIIGEIVPKDIIDEYEEIGPADMDELSTTSTSHANLFSYFDSKLEQGWAGSEHWKIKRTRTLPNTYPERSKSVRQQFAIDFTIINYDSNQLFAKANPASISLSQSAIEERLSNLTILPEDLKYSSNDLIRMFLKPTWKLGKRQKFKLKREHVQLPANPEDTMEENNNESFIDFGPNDNALDFDDFPMAKELNNGELQGSTEVESIMRFGDNLIDVKYPIEGSQVTYSKIAKKVDIQKLKGSMWKGIKQAKSDIAFSSLVQDVAKFGYDGDLADLSIAFCFISILHLANENNLELESIDQSDLRIILS